MWGLFLCRVCGNEGRGRCGRCVRVAAVAVCARDVLKRPLPCRVCSLCRSDRGGVSSHVAVFVFGRSAATVAGRVAVGSWNADGMPCVMSGRAERVRPDVLQLWCQRWNVCSLPLSGDVWPRVRQQVRPYDVPDMVLPHVPPGIRAEVIHGTRHALYIGASYMVHL